MRGGRGVPQGGQDGRRPLLRARGPVPGPSLPLRPPQLRPRHAGQRQPEGVGGALPERVGPPADQSDGPDPVGAADVPLGEARPGGEVPPGGHGGGPAEPRGVVLARGGVPLAGGEQGAGRQLLQDGHGPGADGAAAAVLRCPLLSCAFFVVTVQNVEVVRVHSLCVCVCVWVGLAAMMKLNFFLITNCEVSVRYLISGIMMNGKMTM